MPSRWQARARALTMSATVRQSTAVDFPRPHPMGLPLTRLEAAGPRSLSFRLEPEVGPIRPDEIVQSRVGAEASGDPLVGPYPSTSLEAENFYSRRAPPPSGRNGHDAMRSSFLSDTLNCLQHGSAVAVAVNGRGPIRDFRWWTAREGAGRGRGRDFKNHLATEIDLGRRPTNDAKTRQAIVFNGLAHDGEQVGHPWAFSGAAGGAVVDVAVGVDVGDETKCFLVAPSGDQPVRRSKPTGLKRSRNSRVRWAHRTAARSTGGIRLSLSSV